MKALLLAAVLVGPPAPREPGLLHHIEAARSPRTSLRVQLPLQTLAAGFDLWTTGRCLRAGTCYEANPLADLGKVPYALKGASLAVTMGLTVWAEKTDRRWLAWTITALSVVGQVYLGVRNLRFGP